MVIIAAVIIALAMYQYGRDRDKAAHERALLGFYLEYDKEKVEEALYNAPIRAKFKGE